MNLGKGIKAPVLCCDECEKIVNVNGWTVKDYSVEVKKGIVGIVCWDCEIKEAVCYG